VAQTLQHRPATQFTWLSTTSTRKYKAAAYNDRDSRKSYFETLTSKWTSQLGKSQPTSSAALMAQNSALTKSMRLDLFMIFSSRFNYGGQLGIC